MTAAAVALPAVGVGAAVPSSAATGPAPVGVRTGTAQVSGSGFGHGVGMSQYGALGMARAGASVTQILQHYYSGVTVAGYPDNRDVRVNVVHAARDLTLATTGRAVGGGTWRLLAPGRPAQVLTVGDTAALSVAAGGVSVVVRRGQGATALPTWTTPSLTVQWAGTRALAGPATTVDVVSHRAGSGATKSRSYRWGTLQISTTASRIEGVVVVGMHDEYLRGIAEVPSSWPTAALEAQVVAARNYALAAAAPRAACGGCQLWDDQRSQVFLGWAKEAEGGAGGPGQRWVAAVKATEVSAATGLTVLYRGAPITAYFASSTGGRTRASQDVWGGALPYLRSVADPWSLDAGVNPSFARWTRPVSVAGLRSLFGLPDLVSVRVTSRDSGGAAARVTATAASGASAGVSGEQFRSAFGLPGSWVAGVALPPPPAPSPPRPAPASSLSSSATGSASGSSVGTGTASVRDPSAGLTGVVGAPVVAVPLRLVATGLPVTEWKTGQRSVAGHDVTTRCTLYDRSGYRCLVRMDGQADHAVYFHAYLRAWFGGPLTTPGRRTVEGRATATSCTPAATGARTCRLLTWTAAATTAGATAAAGANGRWVLTAVTHVGGR